MIPMMIIEGKDCCRYYTKQCKRRVSGIKVKSIDTTGAGEAFMGAILYCLASDINLLKDEGSLREALFVNACGALTVTKTGAIPALPTKQVVEQIIKEASV
ncbi:hypothetical protein CASFOL_026634 [Castilleja foliolosa]|uniref:Carbohydrate kinase PfkB domain-containing protein n=1 Tax=Castilleja foliolosa TaxID=1961234 RepID=A0ABD3CIK4_9LAMI